MYNFNKNFNELKVWIRLDAKYDHPTEMAQKLWAIIETLYKNFDEKNYGDLKKIDYDILKCVMDKLEMHYKDVIFHDSVLQQTKESIARRRKIDQGLIAVAEYAVPFARFELTLSELITLYRSLEFVKTHLSMIQEHIWILSDDVRSILFITDIQQQISDRLTYKLCLADEV